jgi:tetratricopeptide (TPR) repeat protein
MAYFSKGTIPMPLLRAAITGTCALAVLLVGCRGSALIRANALLESGDYASARALYARMVATEPGNFAAHYGLGMSWCAEAMFKSELGLAEPDDWFEAISQLTIASRLDTIGEVRRTLAVLHYNLGACFKKNGNIDDAILRIGRAISYDSTLLKAYNLLGTLYQERGELDRAESCYRRVLIIKPDYAMAHFNLGTLCWARKEYGSARKHFVDAAALEPGNGYFETWLGKAGGR